MEGAWDTNIWRLFFYAVGAFYLLGVLAGCWQDWVHRKDPPKKSPQPGRDLKHKPVAVVLANGNGRLEVYRLARKGV